LADLRRCIDVAAVLDRLAQLRLDSRGARQYFCTARIDDLRVHMSVRTMDREARDAQFRDLEARLPRAAQSRLILRFFHGPSLLLLSLFEDHLLVCIAHALTFVRLGTPIRANL